MFVVRAMIITKINFKKLTAFDYSLFTAAAMYLFGSIMPILMAFDVATPKAATDKMNTEYIFFVVSSTDLNEYLMLRQGRRLCCTLLVAGYIFTYVLILKELSKLEKIVQDMSKGANSQRMLKFGKISMISLIVNTITACIPIILEAVYRDNLGVQIGLITYDCISWSTGMLALSSKAETSVIPKLFEDKAVIAEIDSIRQATVTNVTASLGAEELINR
ncbi:hypothetical protein ROZALSC1DRAFT_27078 [Rozella allomycis CSF55]|uniref:Uncharacterized protein n=1 Tax=Rozella allomycis (strain CSF55) TaxID=988480 RepID=A0A4P9YS18_ROZAC|nr:hypothetical protein ROZALSC1DRAFT_27078 [Rozella allomycis CSF55]